MLASLAQLRSATSARLGGPELGPSLTKSWIHYCTAFKNRSAKVCGRGLNLKQRKERAERAEENFMRCCEALEEGDIEAEAMLDTQPGQMFTPNKKSKT